MALIGGLRTSASIDHPNWLLSRLNSAQFCDYPIIPRFATIFAVGDLLLGFPWASIVIGAATHDPEQFDRRETCDF
jgi:hypothetical protein